MRKDTQILSKKFVYHTFDMMGNVWEWMESPYTTGDYLSGSARGIRGGSYNIIRNPVNTLSSFFRDFNDPINETANYGFRVASIPEPCSLALLGLGGLILAKRKQSV